MDFIKIRNFCLSKFTTKRVLADCGIVELICNTSVKGFLPIFYYGGNYFQFKMGENPTEQANIMQAKQNMSVSQLGPTHYQSATSPFTTQKNDRSVHVALFSHVFFLPAFVRGRNNVDRDF